MCGIVGYIGRKQAAPLLIEGLKRLEYRGYDSAGLALLTARGKVFIKKRKGKISGLIEALDKEGIPASTLGIAHTRWATHGAPTEINAHPHTGCSPKICLVHNGIIENYQELKSSLAKQGHKFKSETDTEVAAHLIEEYYKGSLFEAVRRAVKRIKGSFAFGVICAQEPDILVCARRDSPLIVGIGRGENFIASDAPAILRHTKDVIYLEDNQVAELSRETVRIADARGRAVKPGIHAINWDLSSAEKEGFPHFMLKEIFEQPRVLKRIISSRVSRSGRIIFKDSRIPDSELKAVRDIIIVACGTAYHAGLVGKYAIEAIARVPVWVDLSSEFRYRDPIINKNTLVIAISQSGETADTLAAVRQAKAKGAKALTICNVVGSSIVRESDWAIYTMAGPEIGVASTKAYTAQIMTLYLLAIHLASLKNRVSAGRRGQLLKSLKTIPPLCEAVLSGHRQIRSVANNHSHFGCFLFLGRNINYPTALEGALKLKEISYIPAEGYAAGEMKHGPIALIDEYRAVVCVAPRSRTYEKMVSNIQEIRSRRGRVIAVSTMDNDHIKEHADEIIYIPKTEEMFSPLLAVIPLQLIAYYIAVNRKCDVDQPRNLAKSVTVE